MQTNTLTLRPEDPYVLAALEAEKTLFAHYHLNEKTTALLVPGFHVSFRVQTWGEGPPLIVVPGNTGDLYPLIPLLAAFSGRQIIAINRPGGGLSEGMNHCEVNINRFAPQVIERVVEHFGIERADLLAHSMGAHWATLFALAHPQHVKSLTLLGNPGNIGAGAPPFFLKILGMPGIGKAITKRLFPHNPAEGLRILSKMGHKEEVLKALPEAFIQCAFHFRRLPHYTVSLTSLIRNMPDNISYQQLSTLHIPVALLLGTEDNFLTQAQGEQLISACPAGTFYPIPSAGHLPWIECNQLCHDVIEAFIKNS